MVAGDDPVDPGLLQRSCFQHLAAKRNSRVMLRAHLPSQVCARRDQSIPMEVMRATVPSRAARWAMDHWWLLLFALFLPVVGFAVMDKHWISALPSEGRWSARIGLLSSLLLWSNLIVVWWYAKLTRDNFELARKQFTASNRPCVVLAWQGMPAPGFEWPQGHMYVAHNIGPGLAVNVVYVRDLKTPKPDVFHIGALAAGGSVEVPGELRATLVNESAFDRRRHVLVAESIIGGVWIASANLLEAEGRVSHRTWDIEPTPSLVSAIQHETPLEYIERHWTEIRQELQIMADELNQQSRHTDAAPPERAAPEEGSAPPSGG